MNFKKLQDLLREELIEYINTEKIYPPEHYWGRWHYVEIISKKLPPPNSLSTKELEEICNKNFGDIFQCEIKKDHISVCIYFRPEKKGEFEDDYIVMQGKCCRIHTDSLVLKMSSDRLYRYANFFKDLLKRLEESKATKRASRILF